MHVYIQGTTVGIYLRISLSLSIYLSRRLSKFRFLIYLSISIFGERDIGGRDPYGYFFSLIYKGADRSILVAEGCFGVVLYFVSLRFCAFFFVFVSPFFLRRSIGCMQTGSMRSACLIKLYACTSRLLVRVGFLLLFFSFFLLFFFSFLFFSQTRPRKDFELFRDWLAIHLLGRNIEKNKKKRGAFFLVSFHHPQASSKSVARLSVACWHVTQAPEVSGNFPRNKSR